MLSVWTYLYHMLLVSQVDPYVDYDADEMDFSNLDSSQMVC